MCGRGSAPAMGFEGLGIRAGKLCCPPACSPLPRTHTTPAHLCRFLESLSNVRSRERHFYRLRPNIRHWPDSSLPSCHLGVTRGHAAEAEWIPWACPDSDRTVRPPKRV